MVIGSGRLEILKRNQIYPRIAFAMVIGSDRKSCNIRVCNDSRTVLILRYEAISYPAVKRASSSIRRRKNVRTLYNN